MNFKNKYKRYYWTRKVPACLLTLLCHYGKPRLCINSHHYTPPIGCCVMHRGATSLLQSINQKLFVTRAVSCTELESEARAIASGKVLRIVIEKVGLEASLESI